MPIQPPNTNEIILIVANNCQKCARLKEFIKDRTQNTKWKVSSYNINDDSQKEKAVDISVDYDIKKIPAFVCRGMVEEGDISYPRLEKIIANG